MSSKSSGGRLGLGVRGLGVRLGFGLVRGACWLLGLLPHWFLYGPVAGSVRWLLYRVVRYRLGVVRENLSSSFPERSAAELRAIERDFYRNLAEYFVDAIDIASITPRGRIRRCSWPEENRHQWVRQIDGRNWVTLLSHFGSWEMMSSFGLYGVTAMVAAYKPLKNKVFDQYYKRARNSPPLLRSVPSNEILRFISAHREGVQGLPLGIALIADQSPPLDAQSRWVPFLNHPTVFFHGAEKIARKFSLPVYYMRVRRVGRGLWEQTFELIWDGRSPTADYEITGEYARLLEEDIRREPAMWLWSHRRWKRKPEGEHARQYYEKYGGGEQ